MGFFTELKEELEEVRKYVEECKGYFTTCNMLASEVIGEEGIKPFVVAEKTIEIEKMVRKKYIDFYGTSITNVGNKFFIEFFECHNEEMELCDGKKGYVKTCSALVAEEITDIDRIIKKIREGLKERGLPLKYLNFREFKKHVVDLIRGVELARQIAEKYAVADLHSLLDYDEYKVFIDLMSELEAEGYKIHVEFGQSIDRDIKEVEIIAGDKKYKVPQEPWFVMSALKSLLDQLKKPNEVLVSGTSVYENVVSSADLVFKDPPLSNSFVESVALLVNLFNEMPSNVASEFARAWKTVSDELGLEFSELEDFSLQKIEDTYEITEVYRIGSAEIRVKREKRFEIGYINTILVPYKDKGDYKIAVVLTKKES